MAAVYTCIMNTTSTQCLLFVYEFAGDIYVRSKPMGIKKAQIRIWTNNRLVRTGLNYVHQSCIVSTANIEVVFEMAKEKRSFLGSAFTFYDYTLFFNCHACYNDSVQ